MSACMISLAVVLIVGLLGFGYLWFVIGYLDGKSECVRRRMPDETLDRIVVDGD